MNLPFPMPDRNDPYACKCCGLVGSSEERDKRQANGKIQIAVCNECGHTMLFIPGTPPVLRDLTKKEALKLEKSSQFPKLRQMVEAMFQKKGWMY